MRFIQEFGYTVKIGQDEALAFLDEQRRIRTENRQANLDAVFFGLDRLNAEAERREVLLGIENRLHFHEIPDLEEVGMILEQFRGGRLGYWHDVGHARVQEHLGIVQQRDLPQAYAEEMIGVHLHDVKGLEDHLAPGEGEVDFGELAPFVQPSHVKILEVRPTVTREALLQGIELLTSLGMR